MEIGDEGIGDKTTFTNRANGAAGCQNDTILWNMNFDKKWRAESINNDIEC